MVAFRLQSSQLSVREADVVAQERAVAMKSFSFKPGGGRPFDLDCLEGRKPPQLLLSNRPIRRHSG